MHWPQGPPGPSVGCALQAVHGWPQCCIWQRSGVQPACSPMPAPPILCAVHVLSQALCSMRWPRGSLCMQPGPNTACVIGDPRSRLHCSILCWSSVLDAAHMALGSAWEAHAVHGAVASIWGPVPIGQIRSAGHIV